MKDEGNSAISIGGQDIEWERINGGDDIDVDSGGNWSAAVDLPLDANTVEPGDPRHPRPGLRGSHRFRSK